MFCNMDDFLDSTITKLNTNTYNEITVVLGNESCDLDSVVSSLVYANFLSWQYGQMRSKACTQTYTPKDVRLNNDIFVPMLNVDRDDYELKTEVLYYLKSKSISHIKLVFRNDHDLATLLTRSKSKVVLVDHHVLAARDKFLAPHVTEIIDHRPIDKSGWTYKDDVRSTIETVGSCCTLITKRIQDLGTLAVHGVDYFQNNPLCTEMLRAAIILDTVNFSPEVNKATLLDEEMVEFLERMRPLGCPMGSRESVHDSLIAARQNVSGLTNAQLLKKDLKIVGDVLIPSFPILVKEFLKRPGAVQAVSEALVHNKCTVALLLGMDHTVGLHRDIALYSPDTLKKACQLGKYLEDFTNPSLGLSREHLTGAKEFIYYWQQNLSASRKQFIPAVNAFTSN